MLSLAHHPLSEHIYVVILAGGKGKRLFPLSHDDCPKQFTQADKQNTFIQATAKRFFDIGVNKRRLFYYTTNTQQTKLAKEQLESLGVISPNSIERDPKYGYAGAMIKAAKVIYELDKEAIIINTPSDQYIVSDNDFADTILRAITSATNGSPTIIGINATDLNTIKGCGHAQYDLEEDADCPSVSGFTEKPKTDELASKILRDDSFICNTGINVWKAETILKAASDIDVESEGGVDTETLMKAFSNLRVAIGDFRWFDCGTLKSLYDIGTKTTDHKNVKIGEGDTFTWHCHRSLFIAPKGYRLHASFVKDVGIVINEVNGRIVVAVVNLEDSQKVKQFADKFKGDGSILTDDFSFDANNNRVPRTIVEELAVGFVCINNHTVIAIKDPDGTIIISVSDDMCDNKRT